MTDANGKAPDANGTRDDSVERWISNVLRIGVGTAVTLVVVGVIVTFAHHPEYSGSKTQLVELLRGRSAPHSITGVVDGLKHFRGRAIISLGLLVLIATPVARVALSIGIFVRQRDRVFTAITVAVLALLLVSFALGRAI